MTFMGTIRRLRNGQSQNPFPAQLVARHSELSVISSLDDLEPSHDEFLVDLLIKSADLARQVDLTSLIDRCTTADDIAYVKTWPGEHYRLLPALVQALNAQKVVEVGTYQGQGALALRIAAENVLTYDIEPWNNFPASVLRDSDFTNGMEQRIGDLSNPEYFASQRQALMDADLIFVDGPKDGVFEQAFSELLYSAISGSGKVVIWDDIRLMSMVAVWRNFPVFTLDATSFGHWSGTGLTHSS